MTVQVVNDRQPPGSAQAAQIASLVGAGASGFGIAGIPGVIGGIGAVALTPTEWFSNGYLQAEYTFYAIQTKFETDLGLQAAPATYLGSRDGSQALVDQNLIVRVRRPVTFKTVTWVAQRLYMKPLLPHWNTGSKNEKLLNRVISARNPLQSFNHKTWEVTGQYTYAFKKEPFITVDNVEYFVLPAGKTTAENSKIPVSLHAYTQGDFSFVPLDASWIPVNSPLLDTLLPVGYDKRTGLPDAPVPRQGG